MTSACGSRAGPLPPAAISCVVIPFRPDAVVFDLDGVLVDTEPTWAQAEAETVTGLGGAYTREIGALLYGRGHRDGGRILAERFGGEPEAVADTLLQHALAGMRRGVELLPGAFELVESLRGTVPVGIASNSVRVIVETALASAGLDDLFDAVVCGEDAVRPKPAPDPYLVACRALDAEPARSIAVEDSPVGVASAKAAGLYVIGAPQRGVALPEADVVVPTLVGLDLTAAAPDASARRA